MAFSHNLINTHVEPKPGLVECGRWKGKPSLDGKHWGIIRGIERDHKSGIIECLIVDPHGAFFTVLISEVTQMQSSYSKEG